MRVVEEHQDPQIALAHTLDGTLHAFDIHSGDLLWVLPTGSPVMRTYQRDPMDTLHLPGLDGRVYELAENHIEKWPVLLAGMVEATPFQTEDGTLYTADKASKVFAVDAVTGECFMPENRGRRTNSSSLDTLIIGKSEYSLRVFDGAGEKWNMTLSQLKVDFNTKKRVTDAPPPKLVSDNNVLYLLQPQTDRVVWERQFTSPVVAAFRSDSEEKLCVSAPMYLSQIEELSQHVQNGGSYLYVDSHQDQVFVRSDTVQPRAVPLSAVIGSTSSNVERILPRPGAMVVVEAEESPVMLASHCLASGGTSCVNAIHLFENENVGAITAFTSKDFENLVCNLRPDRFVEVAPALEEEEEEPERVVAPSGQKLLPMSEQQAEMLRTRLVALFVTLSLALLLFTVLYYRWFVAPRRWLLGLVRGLLVRHARGLVEVFDMFAKSLDFRRPTLRRRSHHPPSPSVVVARPLSQPPSPSAAATAGLHTPHLPVGARSLPSSPTAATRRRSHLSPSLLVEAIAPVSEQSATTSVARSVTHRADLPSASSDATLPCSLGSEPRPPAPVAGRQGGLPPPPAAPTASARLSVQDDERAAGTAHGDRIEEPSSNSKHATNSATASHGNRIEEEPSATASHGYRVVVESSLAASHGDRIEVEPSVTASHGDRIVVEPSLAASHGDRIEVEPSATASHGNRIEEEPSSTSVRAVTPTSDVHADVGELVALIVRAALESASAAGGAQPKERSKNAARQKKKATPKKSKDAPAGKKERAASEALTARKEVGDEPTALELGGTVDKSNRLCFCCKLNGHEGWECPKRRAQHGYETPGYDADGNKLQAEDASPSDARTLSPATTPSGLLGFPVASSRRRTPTTRRAIARQHRPWWPTADLWAGGGGGGAARSAAPAPRRQCEEEEIRYDTIGNGKLQVSNRTLGTGTQGTIVFAGRWEGRDVAVKRMQRHFYDVADKEVALLTLSDEHPNIVRYFAREKNDHFVYLALELCHSSLSDFVGGLGQSLCHKSKRDILHGMLSGIAHLHDKNIAHRDLKPQNILILFEGQSFRVKVSDFGLSKRIEKDSSSFDSHVHGTTGWRAPEAIIATSNHHSGAGGDATPPRLTIAVDVFTSGCLVHYVLTNGCHPFGEGVDRDRNIREGAVCLRLLEDEHVEAYELVKAMLSQDPSERIAIRDALRHIYFWDESRKLDFLGTVSDCSLDCEKLTRSLDQRSSNVFKDNWAKDFPCSLLDDGTKKYREYNTSSLTHLLRFIRNKKNHYQSLPLQVQRVFGATPDGYLGFFARRFPRLLLEVHSAAFPLYREHPVLKKYYVYE